MSFAALSSQKISVKNLFMLDRIVRIICYRRNHKTSFLRRLAIRELVTKKFLQGAKTEAQLISLFGLSLPEKLKLPMTIKQTENRTQRQDNNRWQDDGGH